MGALNGALNGQEPTLEASWIDDIFRDTQGFLKKYERVVALLLDRDRAVQLWMEKGLSETQAQNIVEPSKPQIAKQTGVSLPTVQNVHRVMNETRIIHSKQAA